MVSEDQLKQAMYLQVTLNNLKKSHSLVSFLDKSSYIVEATLSSDGSFLDIEQGGNWNLIIILALFVLDSFMVSCCLYVKKTKKNVQTAIYIKLNRYFCKKIAKLMLKCHDTAF
jgi:hypothetical protein